MKTARLRENVLLYLNGGPEEERVTRYRRWKDKGYVPKKSGPASTTELLEFINNIMAHGATSQQMGNILSKDKRIVKVGRVRCEGVLSGRYDVCKWASVDWVKEQHPEWDGELLYTNDMGNVEYVKREKRLEDIVTV